MRLRRLWLEVVVMGHQLKCMSRIFEAIYQNGTKHWFCLECGKQWSDPQWPYFLRPLTVEERLRLLDGTWRVESK